MKRFLNIHLEFDVTHYHLYMQYLVFSLNQFQAEYCYICLLHIKEHFLSGGISLEWQSLAEEADKVIFQGSLYNFHITHQLCSFKMCN